ncbi:MAG: cupin domain-containing protein [Kiritimatiellaceae bacterium]|nr:cupin domain-containing protein [Kiritimatiellaceae bacterium]
MKQNLFDPIPEQSQKELFTKLLSTDNIRIERIVSFGQGSSAGFWYEQAENEWVLLLEGSAQIRFDDGLVDLAPGDYLNIQAGERHRVEKTAADGQTVWLAVFYK